MKIKNILGAIIGCVLLTANGIHAAVIDSDWTNFTSGTNQWSTAGNWESFTWTSPNWNPSTATVPNNGGGDTFAARIMNGSANNVVVETDGAVTVGRLWLERTNTGSTTLRLGGDMAVTGTLTGPPASGANSRPTGFYNSVADTPSGLVLDLNGYTFDASGAAPADLQNARNYTIRDTSTNGNGMFVVRNIWSDTSMASGTVNVENNVTVKLTTYAAARFQNSAGSTSDPGWIFSTNATLWLSANGGAAVNLIVGGSEFGNMIVGSEGNATAAVYALGHSTGSSINIKGDLTLHAGSVISMNDTAGSRASRKIFLGGNLTDTNATGPDYGGRAADAGGFFFVGGTNRVQEVLVNRAGLTSLFSVGDTNASASVRLLADFTTTAGTNANSGGTGQFKVWGDSKLDVDQFTLQATTVNISNAATLAFTFGDDTTDALIKATGTLTLNSFNLELNYDGSGWVEGTPILLFEYGTLAGTPVLDNLIAPGGMGFEGAHLDMRPGEIWIVPEPATITYLLLGTTGLFMMLRRRRNACIGGTLMKSILGTIIGCVLLTAGGIHAAVIDSDWTNFTSGTNQWSTAGNWESFTWTSPNWNPSTATVPNNGGGDTFAARIMNGSANNVVVETDGAVTVGRLWLERTNTGSTTLRLGGDMAVTGTLTGPPASGANSRPTGFYNSVADTPSGLVLDLNGYTFDASGAAPADLQNARNYTIRDTSTNGDGMFVVRNIWSDTSMATGTVNVENNVTVKLTTYTAVRFQNSAGSTSDPGWMFSTNATLWLSANGGAAVNLIVGGSEFGNVIVGSEGNATAAVYALGHSTGSSINIKGDLTLHAGSVISMNDVAGSRASRKIFLGGNLTDTNATGSDYGGRADTGGFFFVGGTNRVQEVLVNRAELTSLFSVGDSNAAASVRLLADFTTTVGTNANSGGTGQFKVWGDSKLDVDQFTLQATTVNISNAATLAFTFGDYTTDALIKATGTLTLNSFNLELNYDGSGWSSGDIKLFEYGTKSGTAVVSTLVATNGLEGTLVDRANSIWFVPEARFWAQGAGGGGSGDWSAAGTNWSAMTGMQGGATQSTNRTLIFGGTAGTVTVDGTVSVLKGMQYSTDGYEVTGGTAVSLDGASIAENTITTGEGVGAAINSKLTGTHGLTKAGAGTLTLGGTNDYTGGTLVSEGELAGTTTSLQGDITNNAVLTFNQATDGVYSGVLSGSGTFNKEGTGTVTLSGSAANTQTGAVIVEAGTLKLDKTAGVAAIAGDLTVNSGAKLLVSANNQVADTSNITLSGGTIERASGVSETFGDLNLTAASTLDYGSGAAGTLTFGDYTPSSLLTMNNFFYGNKLVFSSDLSTDINNNTLFSFDHEFTYEWKDSAFTITAIPEPSAYAAAAGLIGLILLWRRAKYFA